MPFNAAISACGAAWKLLHWRALKNDLLAQTIIFIPYIDSRVLIILALEGEANWRALNILGFLVWSSWKMVGLFIPSLVGERRGKIEENLQEFVLKPRQIYDSFISS